MLLLNRVRRQILIWIAFTALLCFNIHIALGDVLHIQPVSAILQKLKNNGYVAIQKIQLVKDKYQIQALDNEGEPVNITMNSHSGEIIAMNKTEAHIPMNEVVDKIEAVGYASITFIEVKSNHYDIIAVGPDGKRTYLKVNAIDGGLTKS
jgi:hypothetical protein